MCNQRTYFQSFSEYVNRFAKALVLVTLKKKQKKKNNKDFGLYDPGILGSHFGDIFRLCCYDNVMRKVNVNAIGNYTHRYIGFFLHFYI